MQRIARPAVAAALAAAAASAHAQVPGDLVFVDDSGTVEWVPFLGGASTNIATFSGDESIDRLLDVEFGPNNNLYLTVGASPVQQPSTARLIQFTDPFGAANQSIVASSDPIQNPLGLVYDAARDDFFIMNNPGSQPPLPTRFEGVIRVSSDGSSVTEVFEEMPFPDPTDFPTFIAGGGIELDPNRPGDLIVSGVESGVNTFNVIDFPGQRGSALFRLTENGDGTFSDTLIVDLSDQTATGLTENIGRTTGFAVVGDSIFASSYNFDENDGAIIRIDLNPDGTFASATDITGPAGITEQLFPEEIEYNPISGSLVFTNRSASDPGIFEIGLDGTGLRNIYNGGTTRGIAVFIPTPATAGLLSAAGLVALRRRRG